MPYKVTKGGLCAPKGFLASAISCGIKNGEKTRDDVALIFSERPCTSAGTFTTNRVKAAPVKVTQAHLRARPTRAIIVNSGNANACTGMKGLQDARSMAKETARTLGLTQREVAVCSTGVIGLPLPMDRLKGAWDELAIRLHRKGGAEVARAIMTSDTHPKEVAVTVDLDGHKVKIGACAKGAGMICPSMATMLCFITTDATVSPASLQKCTQDAVESSLNRICIDGDTSTNDTVLILANGAAGGPSVTRGSKAERQFRDALQYVMLKMAKAIVRDGERVTKFVTVNVSGAATYLDAKKVAEAVGKSALVKSSWNGNDPNWGRIIHAVGYSHARIREELIDIDYDGKAACQGGLVADTPLKTLRGIVEKDRFTLNINLHLGKAEYTLYTTDLSPEYIDFNRSEYAYWKNSRID